MMKFIRHPTDIEYIYVKINPLIYSVGPVLHIWSSLSSLVFGSCSLAAPVPKAVQKLLTRLGRKKVLVGKFYKLL